MIHHLELLAPARNTDIGIAAIDCGADAVYVAGPEFGARQAAGNSMEDIRRLTEYAHRFGVRIFLTLNTILFDNELQAAERLLAEAKDAGVDAVIAQDLAVWSLTDLPVHASTQCAVRTPEKARLYERLGASRLVLEREMSLDQIKAVRKAVGCELEFFVHGALCVCYSGQCYLSERIAGRSANRGECIQACRSIYNLEDADGKVLARGKALLSLKDYNLKDRLEDLAEAGICSFKIEGRLKNASYVRNVTRAYSLALDKLVAAHPEKYRRASFGRVEGGFTPDLGKTFNRGYTQLFIDGKRSGHWSSMDAPKSIGEEIGTVVSVSRPKDNNHRFQRPYGKEVPASGKRSSVQGGEVTITVRLKNPAERLRNGDGFSFISQERGEIVGFRGDVCEGDRIRCGDVPGIFPGAKLFRNLSAAFEKELDSNQPKRLIQVAVDVRVGNSVTEPVEVTGPIHPALRQAGVVRQAHQPAEDQRPESGQQSNQDLRPGNYRLIINAVSEDGRAVTIEREAGDQPAENAERMRGMFAAQISKATGAYSFTLRSLETNTSDGSLPFLPASTLNAVRRDIAEALEKMPCKAIPLAVNYLADKGVQPLDEDGTPVLSKVKDIQEKDGARLSYKANIANHIARETYLSLGAAEAEEAFEISHRPDTELIRTKYCIKYEFGLCPASQQAGGTVQDAGERHSSQHPSARPLSASSHLYLTNNGKRYPLSFDCANCEMIVKGSASLTEHKA